MLKPRPCAIPACRNPFIPQKQSDKYCSAKCRCVAARKRKRQWWNRNRATVGRASDKCKNCGQPFKIERSRQLYCSKCGGDE